VVVDGADVYLQLDRTRPAGGLTPGLVAAVHAFCDQVEDTPDAAMAVLNLDGTGTGTGTAHGAAGGAGPAGGWPGDVEIGLVGRWERALRRVERLGTATIAVASGRCDGGAAELLLATDYRVATPDFRLSIGAAVGAAWPGMAVHRLAQQLGPARARRLVLFGAEVSAAEAVELGVLDRVGEDRRDLVLSAAAAVGALAPAELAIRRRLLLDAAGTTFETALGVHLAACDRELRRTRAADPADGG
jgi:isomerase DpgB